MTKIMTFSVAWLLLASAGAKAQVSAAEWEQFKTQFAAMSERLNALEAENRELRAAGGGGVRVEDLAATNAEVEKLKAQNGSSSWAERIKWQGDFRYRYEDIQEDGRDDRDRNRIRARPALVAKTGDNTEVGFGLATGSDDPVSSNQTLGGAGSSKNINLDLAYATWTGLENTAITAGKFKNPYYKVQKSGLIFDGDFRPEGLSVSWAGEVFFANAGYNFIESDSRNDDDGIWGGQVGATFQPLDAMSVTASAAYYDVPTEGREAIFDDDFFGNSTVTVADDDADDEEAVKEVYEYDYKLITASLEFGFNVFDMPLSLYGDYVKNDEDDVELDTGYIAGIKLGKAKKRGSWQLQYQYQDLEADATFGVITDSDFAGGGTDGKGSKFAAKYALTDKWYVGATYFDNKRGMDLGNNADYERLQVDTGFKY